MFIYMRWTLLLIITFTLVACKEEKPQSPAVQPDENLPKIIAFGNSLTAGLGLPANESYPAFLQQMLNADGYEYEVINAGVSGDTTAGGLRRIDWSLQDGAEILILELGGNDVLRGQPVTEMKTNLAAMIEKAHAQNVKVLLAGIEAPTNSGPEYRKEVHDAFQELADEYKIPFIPFFLSDLIGSEKYIQADGTHPTAEGSRILAKMVYERLKPLLRKDAPA